MKESKLVLFENKKIIKKYEDKRDCKELINNDGRNVFLGAVGKKLRFKKIEKYI